MPSKTGGTVSAQHEHEDPCICKLCARARKAQRSHGHSSSGPKASRSAIPHAQTVGAAAFKRETRAVPLIPPSSSIPVQSMNSETKAATFAARRVPVSVFTRPRGQTIRARPGTPQRGHGAGHGRNALPVEFTNTGATTRGRSFAQKCDGIAKEAEAMGWSKADAQMLYFALFSGNRTAGAPLLARLRCQQQEADNRPLAVVQRELVKAAKPTKRTVLGTLVNLFQQKDGVVAVPRSPGLKATGRRGKEN